VRAPRRGRALTHRPLFAVDLSRGEGSGRVRVFRPIVDKNGFSNPEDRVA
jgi:hypothetical protein